MTGQKPFSIHFPDIASIPQGEEYFILKTAAGEERIRFHDYDRIYQIPGLYEHLFYDRYKCNSPEVVCGLLNHHLSAAPDATGQPLSVLDLGAGNGMVGELLIRMGAGEVVGIDIIEEAATALERDRPNVYADYYVADITRLSDEVETALTERNFNCMTVVAALGFGDIPPRAFAEGYNMVTRPGWVAFNIKEDFVCEDDTSGFCKLIHEMSENDIFEIEARKRYRHRFCQDGTPLFYEAVVGRKTADIPEDMIRAHE